MSIVDHRTVYYLPGHGGQLATGLGQGLMDRGFHVAGRETRGDFRSLPSVAARESTPVCWRWVAAKDRAFLEKRIATQAAGRQQGRV